MVTVKLMSRVKQLSQEEHVGQNIIYVCLLSEWLLSQINNRPIKATTSLGDEGSNGDSWVKKERLKVLRAQVTLTSLSGDLH